MAFPDFLNEHAETVAPRLLGCKLVRTFPTGIKGSFRIVETEAYHQTDAASHSYRGQTPRTEIMFGPSGFAYVYFTYGMHFCFNIVTGETGEGSAVLIRAIEPIPGETDRGVLAILGENRHGADGVNLTNGPAKLAQALEIDKRSNGHDMRKAPFQLISQPQVEPDQIVTTTRIGITRERDRLWRFYLKDNLYVSHPR